MKHKLILLLSFLALFNNSFAQQAKPLAKTDPDHKASGGYGYSISENDQMSVWWAEGIYKVMRSTPAPKAGEKGVIRLNSAKNESESFILVFNPKKERAENTRVRISNLTSATGATISADDIDVRSVEYVEVTHPTDYYGYKGMWPDPLPLHEEAKVMAKGENTPFWITVKVPAGIEAGLYKGTVTAVANGWQEEIPVEVNVWDIELPQSPTMRSGFGMNINVVAEYDNLHTMEQKEQVFEYYMQAYRDYKLSPYDPFVFSNFETKITGVEWTGGFFDSKNPRNGKYSYKVVDNSATENIEAVSRSLTSITPGNYTMTLEAKAEKQGQDFVIGVECYDALGELMIYENRFEIFKADTSWREFKLPLGRFDEQVKSIKVYLCASNRTVSGEDKGTVWFDDLVIAHGGDKAKNILAAGDFEINIDQIDISFDFDKFSEASKRYFDEYGFNAFRFILKGLGGGTYYSRRAGVFEGFEQGTPEYNRLMERYLNQVETKFEELGILGKEYVYWFDEPGEPDYPFVYETNKMIKEYAPKITTFLTEHVAGQDISDVTDISCTIWHQLNHDKIKKMNENGLEHWSYLCVWPKAPWISEFIDHDAINMRLWSWASYKHGLKGILMWETTNWTSPAAAQKGELLNPWDNAMAWVRGYGYPLGKQTIWGNGDGRFFYPNNRNVGVDKTTYIAPPVPSLRLEVTRDGIEDYELLVMLEDLVKNAPKSKKALAAEASKLLEIPSTMYVDEKTYEKSPKELLERREAIAEMILKLK